MTRLRWAADWSFSSCTTARHQVVRLIVVDAATACGGDRRAVKTFFDYAHKMFLHRIDATGEAIWMSGATGGTTIPSRSGEREGENRSRAGSGSSAALSGSTKQPRCGCDAADPARPGPYFVHYAA